MGGIVYFYAPRLLTRSRKTDRDWLGGQHLGFFQGPSNFFVRSPPAIAADKLDSNRILGAFVGATANRTARLETKFVAADRDIGANRQRIPQLET